MFEKRMNTSDLSVWMMIKVSLFVVWKESVYTLMAYTDHDIDQKNDVIILDIDEQVVKTSSRMGEHNSFAKPENKKKKVWTEQNITVHNICNPLYSCSIPGASLG